MLSYVIRAIINILEHKMNKSEAQKIAHDIATELIDLFPAGPYCNFNNETIGALTYCSAFDSLCNNEPEHIAKMKSLLAIFNNVFCFCNLHYTGRLK